MSLPMHAPVSAPKVRPLSLKDAPCLIERVFPSQKISVEAQKERKAVHGQTLTGLGSYWKGRKPLVLARACIIGALLPSTGDDEKDLQIFELLVGMNDAQVAARLKFGLNLEEIESYATHELKPYLIEENDGSNRRIRKLPREKRKELLSQVIARMPYQARVEKLLRPEEVSESDLISAYIS